MSRNVNGNIILDTGESLTIDGVSILNISDDPLFTNSDDTTLATQKAVDDFVQANSGISEIHRTPMNFLYDDTDIGVDNGVLFSMIDTANFSSVIKGSLWFNVPFSDSWGIVNDTFVDLEYSNNALDAGTTVIFTLSCWYVSIGDTPNVSIPDASFTYTITSSTSNTNTISTSSITIPNNSIPAGTEKIIFKLSRDIDNDTLDATCQVSSVIVKQ